MIGKSSKLFLSTVLLLLLAKSLHAQLTCSPFYYADTASNSCKLCSSITSNPNCEICEDLGSTCSRHASCRHDTYFDANRCKECMTGCEYCTQAVECEVCKSGYVLKADKSQCIACSTVKANCMKCTESVCEECAT